MFELTRNPIDLAWWRKRMVNSSAGALVTFEGLVRNHNEGRPVLFLEYESFDALALREGSIVVKEALSRFGVLDARCIHRIGRLKVCEMAVWVGVTAVHRREAFEACEYVIDQVKHRVPIWKKEFYSTGDSEWARCDACAGHALAGR
jgi:molybdopterin synthase catalytic subunit